MKTPTRRARLGVDFGRVINAASGSPQGSPQGEDTAFLGGSEQEMLATPAMAGAFEALTRLCSAFQGRIWIVSKCGPVVQGRTERWLAHHRFFEVTGIDPGHLRFCRQRADKAIHCRQLAITHFVDDRYDVLCHLEGLVPHLFLFGPQEHDPPPGVVPVPTWPEAERAILASGD